MLVATSGDASSSYKGPEPCVAPAHFPRTARLLKAGEYERVFKYAIRSRDDGFTVLATTTMEADTMDSAAISRISSGASSGIVTGTVTGMGPARLGLAISKRQIRSAAKRNRLKRRIRESFRHHQLDLKGIDIVVMARRGVDEWTSDAIYSSLTRHWRQVIRKCAA